MKKVLGLIGIVALAAQFASAAMDDRDFTVAVTGLGTNSTSYVLRGELKGVYVDVPASQTGTVSVTSSQATLFSKADITTDAFYLPRTGIHQYTGAAATFNTYSSTNSLQANAQTIYDAFPMAGSITVTVIGQTAGTTAVNYVVTLIYEK